MHDAVVGRIEIIDKSVAAKARYDESSWSWFSPKLRKDYQSAKPLLDYHGLRDAFLNTNIPTLRHDCSHHEAKQGSNQLTGDFNCADYLANSMSKTLTELVEIGASTWFTLWLIFLPFWLIMEVLNNLDSDEHKDGTKVVIYVVSLFPYVLLSIMWFVIQKLLSIKDEMVQVIRRPRAHFDGFKGELIKPATGPNLLRPFWGGAPPLCLSDYAALGIAPFGKGPRLFASLRSGIVHSGCSIPSMRLNEQLGRFARFGGPKRSALLPWPGLQVRNGLGLVAQRRRQRPEIFAATSYTKRERQYIWGVHLGQVNGLRRNLSGAGRVRGRPCTPTSRNARTIVGPSPASD
jgi:hypothetical protein